MDSYGRQEKAPEDPDPPLQVPPYKATSVLGREQVPTCKYKKEKEKIDPNPLSNNYISGVAQASDRQPGYSGRHTNPARDRESLTHTVDPGERLS